MSTTQPQPQPQPHALTIRTPPSLSPPSTSAHPTPSTFTAPSLSFFQGTWHVTHSTLPMWRKNRNVEITYTPLPSKSAGSSHSPMQLTDEVAYYTIGSPKRSTVVGVDTACGREGGELGAFDWRGKGLMRLVSSHWEILGWGYIGAEGEGSEAVSDSLASGPQDPATEPQATAAQPQSQEREGQPAGKEEDAWMVIWFSKTVFTPTGIDVFARSKQGHAPWVVEKIKETLAGMEEEAMRKFGGELFEVVRE